MSQQIQLRRGTASAWTSANPTLAIGELGVETDTGNFKIGDGSNVWNNLIYHKTVDSIVEVTTSKTLALTDIGTVQKSTSASAVTITIPTNAAVAFPVQTQIAFLREGAGTVTFAGAGVTINAEGAKRSISAQYGSACLIKTATDTWSLVGALAT